MNEPMVGDAAGEPPPSDFGLFGRGLLLTSKVASAAGGLVFVGLVAMSIVSIVGRKLASAPVPGDVEVLQMCAAVASSTFFAYCHLNRGDVKVDFFTQGLRAPTVARLDALGSLLVGVFGLLLAWRTGVGAAQLAADGESSAILAWPVWVPVALMVPGFLLLGTAGLYMAVHQWRRAQTGASA